MEKTTNDGNWEVQHKEAFLIRLLLVIHISTQKAHKLAKKIQEPAWGQSQKIWLNLASKKSSWPKMRTQFGCASNPRLFSVFSGNHVSLAWSIGWTVSGLVTIAEALTSWAKWPFLKLRVKTFNGKLYDYDSNKESTSELIENANNCILLGHLSIWHYNMICMPMIKKKDEASWLNQTKQKLHPKIT